MVTLKLTLKSKKPSNVYAVKGKAYRLQPGSNTLHLEYDDYVSLAKALGIKPVAKDEDKKSPSNDSFKPEPKKKKVNTESPAPVKEEKTAPVDSADKLDIPTGEPEPVEEPEHAGNTVQDRLEDAPEESDALEQANNELPSEPAPVATDTVEEPASINEEPTSEDDEIAPASDEKDVDYSSWSYTKLKAEYKAITGNTCKLKKADVIQFLQEHNSNV